MIPPTQVCAKPGPGPGEVHNARFHQPSERLPETQDISAANRNDSQKKPQILMLFIKFGLEKV